MKRARYAARGAIGLLSLGLMVVGSAAVAAPGDITRISIAQEGGQANGDSGSRAVSADGRFVAFRSYATNLVQGQSTLRGNIFVYDRHGGRIELVSVSSSGVQGNAQSYHPALSSDGRFVAFLSIASNLVADDTNVLEDVFVHDRQTGITERVSVTSEGEQSHGQTLGWGPTISGDGRYVVFESTATDLVADDTNNTRDVFVHDRARGVTERISLGPNGQQVAAESSSPAISADGRYVAFVSQANFATGGLFNTVHVHVRDRVSAITQLVSIAPDGGVPNWTGDSLLPSISEGGRFVAFQSNAYGIWGEEPNTETQILVRDRQEGITHRVTVGTSGGPGDGPSMFPSLSADGRLVAFQSRATNLVADDTNGVQDIFVYDLRTGVTERVSRSAGGAQSDDLSGGPSVDAEGRFIVFSSAATNLVAGDTNTYNDVFVRERAVNVPTTEIGLILLPQLNVNGTDEVAVLRGTGALEIRDGRSGALLQTLPALSEGLWPVATKPLPDSDGNGVPELAVLATRQRDGRAVVEIRNLTGAAALRQIWFAPNHTPLALAVLSEDADNNGVVEIAVLSRRDSDGRGLVEVKNAFGPTNASSIWTAAGFTPIDFEIAPDADTNGVPEVAVLSVRDSDGRILAEVKNVLGATNPRAVWFMAGNTALDLTVVGDSDENGVPEVAVLSKRDSDGRLVVEMKNVVGAANPRSIWFAAGHTGLALKALQDADGNGVPELAMLSKRDSDGRVLVEVKNAAGATNPRSLWYPAGYTAWDLGVLPDLDGNGIEEVGVLLTRDSDDRILVEGRNVVGPQSAQDYWFSP